MPQFPAQAILSRSPSTLSSVALSVALTFAGQVGHAESLIVLGEGVVTKPAADSSGPPAAAPGAVFAPDEPGAATSSPASQSGPSCWEFSAAKYSSFGITPHLLWAIAKTESNLNPAAINRNKNGSEDVSIMQINSIWYPTLSKMGISRAQLISDPCLAIDVGAWILAQNFRRLGASWEAVGAYNSSTPALRDQYAWKVYRSLASLGRADTR